MITNKQLSNKLREFEKIIQKKICKKIKKRKEKEKKLENLLRRIYVPCKNCNARIGASSERGFKYQKNRKKREKISIDNKAEVNNFID